MKSLFECLQESLVVESSDTVLRFEFGDLDKKDETIKSIEDIASKNSIYTEKVDNGIKIKVNDSNKDKLDSIQDILQQYVDKMKDDDKADQSSVEKLAGQLNKLTDFIESEEDNDKEDPEKKEEKKEDGDDE